MVKLNPEELRLPARAWKVKLLGEGADDAGGVFDDTITEMCKVSFLIIRSLSPPYWSEVSHRLLLSLLLNHISTKT